MYKRNIGIAILVIFTFFFTFFGNIIAFADDSSADLKAITYTINGESQNITLVANKYSYDIILPAGTDTIPEIAVQKLNSNQFISVTNPSPGFKWTYTIKCESADGINTKIYTINFSVKVDGNSDNQPELLLKTLYYTIGNGGNIIQIPITNEAEYTILLPKNTTLCPILSATSEDMVNTSIQIEQITEVPGTATITLKRDNTTTVYNISFEIDDGSKSNVATLSQILIDEKPLAGFNKDKLEYTISIPFSLDEDPPTLECIPTDNNADVSIDNIEIGSPVNIIVTSSDETTTKTYKITFVFQDTFNVSIDNITNVQGNVIKIPIKFNKTEIIKGIKSCNFAIYYDNSILTIKNITAGSIIKNQSDFSANAKNDQINFLFGSDDNSIVSSGVFATIEAEINVEADPDQYDLEFVEQDNTKFVSLTDEDINNYFLSNSILTITSLGDVDGDGQVTAKDFMQIKRYVSLSVLGFPTAYGTKAADVNRDGKVNSTDSAWVKRFLLGMIESFSEIEN